jgi:hypothetical protein
MMSVTGYIDNDVMWRKACLMKIDNYGAVHLMNGSSAKNQIPHEAGKEYWGLNAICRRMNWKNSRTPVRQALSHGFPLYLKTRVGQHRQFYYSTEKLIASWEWSRCEREIERLVRNTPLAQDPPMYRLPHQEPSRDIPNK